MRLEMRRVDNQQVRLSALCSQRRKDAVEHPEPAPADEAAVNRLARTVILGRIASAQAVPDDEDDPDDHPTIISPRHPM